MPKIWSLIFHRPRWCYKRHS